MTRVTPQGIVLDSIPVLPALARDGWYTQHSNTSLGPPPFDGAYFHLVYTRSVPDTLWLHDSRIGPSGPLVDSVSVPLVRYGVQSNNGCAFGDSTYLLAWIDRRNGVKNITYAARIRRDRTALDTFGFKVNLLDSAIATGDYIADVAYNGSLFLVAWSSVGGQVWASRVTEGGAVLDSTPIRLTKGIAQWPMVASDGRDFLVTFSLEDTLLGCNTVSGCRVSGGGVVLDSIPLRISARCSSGVRTLRGLTFNGWDYQVLWNEIYQDGGKVFGARVNSAGLVKDTLQPPLFPDGLWGNQAKPAAAASPGGKVLVVWVRTLIGDLHAYGAFLDTTGREGVEEKTSSVNPVPLRFALAQNAPNPWASGTRISYSLTAPGEASLAIYDALGRRVRAFSPHALRLTPHEVFWDGRDDGGRRVPSGVYFYRLQAGAFSDTKKMVVIR